MVLLAVMIVIVLGALIGATLLVAVDAERSGAQTTIRQTQSRALAWSGVQMAMAEFAAQRDAMIAAEPFEIETEWELFKDERGRTAVVRLIPIGEDEALNVSETAKLDINHATKDMLAALPGIGTPERAQAIIDARPFSSVEELVRIDGFAADLIYGFTETPDAFSGFGAEPTADSNAALDDASLSEDFENLGTRGDFGEASDRALIDLLTVFSFDPNVQAGLADPSKAGKLRVNLNVPWSDRLARAIEDQWGEEAVQVAERVFEQGMNFSSDKQVIENMLQLGLSTADQIAPIIDAITASDDMYRLGRIDVNLAAPEVLATLPGLDLAAAYELVDVRERLSAEDMLSPLWMVEAGVMAMDGYAAVADHVTTRSTQWRVRVEAGYRSVDAIAEVAGVSDSVMEGLARDLSMGDELEDRVMYDVVIDASSQRPRVAYLREVTLLELAHALRGQEIDQRGGRDRDTYEDELASALGLDDLDAHATDGATMTDDEIDSDSPSWRDESRIDQRRDARRIDRETTTNQNRRADRAASAANEPEPDRTMPGEPVDRRSGRWRARGGR